MASILLHSLPQDPVAQTWRPKIATFMFRVVPPEVADKSAGAALREVAPVTKSKSKPLGKVRKMTKNQLSIVLRHLLLAIILVCLLVSIFFVSNAPADTVESTPVTGITREVNGNILPGVSITLDSVETVVSDQNGQYQIMATSTGNHTILAQKDGFRERTQTISIYGLGEAYAVTCNFQGTHGLIPNAPDIWYALACINRWLYPPGPDTGLNMETALAVINAWLYPASPTPSPTPTPTPEPTLTPTATPTPTPSPTPEPTPTPTPELTPTPTPELTPTPTPEPTPTPTPEPTPTPIPAPIAGFGGTPTICNGPTTVYFTDTSTGEITSWSWNFGDGHTSTLQNPSNYYSYNGYFTVSLTVIGPGGTDVETKNSYIYVYGCGG